MSTAQIQGKLSMKITQKELDSMLRRTVYQQSGVAKGYTPGTFIKVEGKWAVKQLGVGDEFTPQDFIARII